MSKKLFAFLSLLTAFAFSEVRASDGEVVAEEESAVAAAAGVQECTQAADWAEWATRLSATTGDTWRADFAELVAALGERESHASLVTRLRGALDAGDDAEWHEAVEAVTAALRAKPTDAVAAAMESLVLEPSGDEAPVAAAPTLARVPSTGAGEADEEAGLAPVSEAAVVEQAADRSASESGDDAVEGDGSN